MIPPDGGPYRADIWHRDLFRLGEPPRHHVLGPTIAGGWDGTVPRSHDGMTLEDARWLADLMNRAYRAGRADAQAEMRRAMGVAE